MIAVITGLLGSLIISMFGAGPPKEQPCDQGQFNLKYYETVPGDNDVGTPIEALGGGFKKHRQ